MTAELAGMIVACVAALAWPVVVVVFVLTVRRWLLRGR